MLLRAAPRRASPAGQRVAAAARRRAAAVAGREGAAGVAAAPRHAEPAATTAALTVPAQPCPRLAALGALALAASALAASPALAAEVAAATATAGGFQDFQEAFVEASLLIFFSEIGDKTFFIAVLLALQQPRGLVFTGTFGALAVMSVVSVALGRLLHVADAALQLESSVPWDDYAAVVLLLFFGLKTLAGASESGAKAEEEQADARDAVAGLGGGGGGGGATAPASAGVAGGGGSAASAAFVASTFALVFAAEWGDKSFLATIALAAAADPAGVTAGACAGHGVATAVAVAGGSLLRGQVSEKAVALVGGGLFIAAAAVTAAELVARGGGVAAA